MAGEPQIPKTISELTELENPQSTDVLPISRGQNTDKITAENLIGKTRLSGLRTTDKTVVGAINEAAQSGGSSTLDGLDDVDINTPTDGQTLQYDGTTEKWKNVAGGSGGASALEELTDVDITTPQDGDTLVYDSENDKWVNGEGGGGSAKQVALTQAEYDALVQAGTVDPTMEYFITDGIPASESVYTISELFRTSGNTSFSNVILSDTIDNYDEIEIVLSFDATDRALSTVRVNANWFKTTCSYVSDDNTNNHLLCLLWAGQGFSCAYNSSNNEIKQWGYVGNCGIYAVNGIKY